MKRFLTEIAATLNKNYTSFLFTSPEESLDFVLVFCLQVQMSPLSVYKYSRILFVFFFVRLQAQNSPWDFCLFSVFKPRRVHENLACFSFKNPWRVLGISACFLFKIRKKSWEVGFLLDFLFTSSEESSEFLLVFWLQAKISPWDFYLYIIKLCMK